MILTSLAIAFSAAPLILLGIRDPKRLRNLAKVHAGLIPRPLPRSVRRICVWALALPGFALALAGHWWSFLIWCGAVLALGWIVAQLFAIRALQ